MRTTLSAMLAVGLVLHVVGPARTADDSPDKIIARAIKAQGGEAKLAKVKAATWKVKGTFSGMGTPTPLTGEMAWQAPNQFKIAMELDGGAFKFASIYAGDKGWIKLGDAALDMDKDQLDEQKQALHAFKVSRLAGLQDKAYTLSPLGDAKVDKRPAVGVKVAHKGFRDVNLYFDKETGLLAKSETQSKDIQGQEAKQETFYTDYKEVEGIKMPAKFVIKRDGNLFLETESFDWKSAAKLDDSVFAKP